MKLVKEHINEKFTEESDPIQDMNIGAEALFKTLKWGLNDWFMENIRIKAKYDFIFYRGYYILVYNEKEINDLSYNCWQAFTNIVDGDYIVSTFSHEWDKSKNNAIKSVKMKINKRLREYLRKR